LGRHSPLGAQLCRARESDPPFIESTNSLSRLVARLRGHWDVPPFNSRRQDECFPGHKEEGAQAKGWMSANFKNFNKPRLGELGDMCRHADCGSGPRHVPKGFLSVEVVFD
jgi:hypothetical protein